MRAFVFRQDAKTPANAPRLYAELKAGRLRQGWSWHPGMDLTRPKSKWMQAYRAHSGEGVPKNVHRKLSPLLRVLPDDLLIIPEQPRLGWFTLARATRSPFDQRGGCYEYLIPLPPVPGGPGADFRSCIRVARSSVVSLELTDRRVPPAVRRYLTGSAYRSPISFVKEPTLAAGLERLLRNLGTDATVRAQSRDHGDGWGTQDVGQFSPKSDGDVEAHLPGGVIVKSRAHETIVRRLGEYLQRRGHRVETPHPIDLWVRSPRDVLVEVKTTGAGTVAAVREGLGQLLWYRFEYARPSAGLVLALDCRPTDRLLHFLEQGAEIGVIWMTKRGPAGGFRAASLLPCIELP